MWKKKGQEAERAKWRGMDGERWKGVAHLIRVEEYVYNSMYDLTNHDPVLYLNNGTKVLLIDDPILSDVQLPTPETSLSAS